MLEYVRKTVDGKLISVNEPEPVQEAAHEMLYHIDPRQPEEEALGFNTIAEYDRFLKDNGLWKEDAPHPPAGRDGQRGLPRAADEELYYPPPNRLGVPLSRHQHGARSYG